MLERNSKYRRLGEEARKAMDTIQDTISLYYDEVYDIDQALAQLRIELETAKAARDTFFNEFPEEMIP